MALDVHRLRVALTGAGQFMQNILTFQSTVTNSTTPETDSNALIVAYTSTMLTPLMACLSPDTSLLGMKAERINNTGGPSTIQVPSSSIVGTFTGPIENTRMAALITADYYSADSTPPQWRVGKQFLGGIPKTAQTDNAWLGPFVVAVQAYAAALIADASSTPGPWTNVIWSSKYLKAYTITSWELTPQTAALKRRIKPYL